MKTFRKKIYATAGYNTVYFGSGRKEFNPKKPMPAFEDYLHEAAKGTCAQLPAADFDEGVIGNFMAPRFIRQANLPGFLPAAVPSLLGKPCAGVEGACGSGGMALGSGIRSLLSDLADSVFVLGFEIQNTMKAVYGADVLAGAGYYRGERKHGHAYFFPSLFSDRAGAYGAKYGKDLARRGMAKWYESAILNARRHAKAQENHNTSPDLFTLGLTPPDPKSFVEHLNYYDCSKVSDGASSIALLTDEGLTKLGVKKTDCVEIMGMGQAEDDITKAPPDNTVLHNTARAARAAYGQAGVTAHDLGLLEVHDCFSITGLLALEALGLTSEGHAATFVLDGHSAPGGKLPVNASGGLIGFGHPTGATGVRQLVDLWLEMTGRAENPLHPKKDHGMMVSMGGNDKTVTALVVRRAA